jgi:hypothetical protein
VVEQDLSQTSPLAPSGAGKIGIVDWESGPRNFQPDAAVIDAKTDLSTQYLVTLAFRHPRGLFCGQSGSGRRCSGLCALPAVPFGCARNPDLHLCRSGISIFGVINPPMRLSYLTAVGLATRAMVGVRKVAEHYKLCKDHTRAHCVSPRLQTCLIS